MEIIRQTVFPKHIGMHSLTRTRTHIFPKPIIRVRKKNTSSRTEKELGKNTNFRTANDFQNF